MFSFSLGRKGQSQHQDGDKFQPTRDKEATSQECAWGKGIQPRAEEEGALLPPHIKGLLQLPVHFCPYQGSWRAWAQGANCTSLSRAKQ